MNKKGFTLVELISVIAILAILIVLTIPTYNNVSNNIKQRNFDSKKSVIEKQTIEYVNKYLKEETYNYINRTSKNVCFSVRFLIRNGIITSDKENDEVIINDVNNDEYKGNKYIVAVSYDNASRKLIAKTIGDEEIENYSPTTPGNNWFDEKCNTKYD